MSEWKNEFNCTTDDCINWNKHISNHCRFLCPDIIAGKCNRYIKVENAVYEKDVKNLLEN